MTIEMLRIYLALCQSLHFGRTSQAFHLSPSALSRAVQRLEAEVGQRLLMRDNRGVAITPQGEIFREYAQDAVTRWEEMQVAMGLSEERLSGRITLFASVTASLSILPNVLSRFRERHPDIQIQLETGYAVNALGRLREGADVVVAALPDELDDRFVQQGIMDIPVLCVAPAGEDVLPALEMRDPDWSTVPMVLPPTGQVRDNIDDWFRVRGKRPHIYSEVSGNEAILSLVALGCGIGFVPRLVLEMSPIKDRVRVVKAAPQLADFHVGFCTRRRTLESSPLVRAFWDSIGEGV